MGCGKMFVLDRCTFGTGGENDRKDIDFQKEFGAVSCLTVISNTATGGGDIYVKLSQLLEGGEVSPLPAITLSPGISLRLYRSDGVLVTGMQVWGSASSTIFSVVASRGDPPIELPAPRSGVFLSAEKPDFNEQLYTG